MEAFQYHIEVGFDTHPTELGFEIKVLDNNNAFSDIIMVIHGFNLRAKPKKSFRKFYELECDLFIFVVPAELTFSFKSTTKFNLHEVASMQDQVFLLCMMHTVNSVFLCCRSCTKYSRKCMLI